MRPKTGPADLRNSKLNRETDARQLMRPKPGPSDLRYSNLQPEKELRDIMKPKPLSEPEEGEVESSTEDELPPEEELTNVIFSENPSQPETNQTSTPGPSTGNKPREVKQTKKKPSPIKPPGASEKTHSGEDIPLNKLATPKRSRSLSRKDLRRKLDKVPVFSEPKLHNDKGPLQYRIDRDLPGPCKAGRAPIPKCGTEQRHRPFIAGGKYAHYESNQSSNWPNSQWQQADEEEEEEGERLSEDDISTDECGGYDSSEEEGAWFTSPNPRHSRLHTGCLDPKKFLSTIDAPPGVPGVSKNHIFFSTNKTAFLLR